MPRSYTSIQDLLLQSDQVEAYKAIGVDLIHSFDDFDVATNSMMPRMVEAHQPRTQGPLSSSLEKVPWFRLVTWLA